MGTENRPGLIFAWPVFHPVTGHAEGMVVARLDLSTIMAVSLANTEFTAGGALRSGAGDILARAGHEHEAGPESIMVRHALALPSPLAALGLEIVLSESLDHASEPLRTLALRFTVFGILLLLVIAYVGLRLGERLTARLVALNLAAQRVADGDLDAVPCPTVGDEIGQLTLSFNRMIDRIRTSHALLEARVDARTAALEATSAELLAAKERLGLVISGTGVGIWDWNPQTGDVVFNERWAEIVGYTLAELQPVTIETWMSLAHPDDLQASAAALEEVFAGRSALYECDARMRHKDGHWVWVRDTGRVMARDSEGRVTRVVGTHLDITAERSLFEQVAGYRDQLEAILAAVPDGIMTIDAKRRITRVNAAAADVLGWPADQLVGRDLSILIPAELAPGHDALAGRFILEGAGGRRQMAGWRTVMGRRQDGSLIPLLVTLSSTVLNGQPIVVAAFKDVTVIEQQKSELRSLAEQLRDQLRLAQDANRAKTRFLAAMSHELRTPLNAIIGFSEMVALDSGRRIGPATREEYAGDVARAGQHLLSLINDLLDLARIEENRLELDIETCAPAELLADPVRMLRPGMREKRITLLTKIEPGLPPVEADARAVKQILINLLGNAAKFTPPSGTVSVSVGADGDGRHVSFEVEDTGCGIPPEKLPHLAQPFVQVNDHWQGAASGLGLGLAISRRLVERMAGSFTIESAYGAWTRVTFTLPATNLAPGPSDHSSRLASSSEQTGDWL